MVGSAAGAAILGTIAVLFLVAVVILSLALCKLFGKCGFNGLLKKVYLRKKNKEWQFLNKSYDADIPGIERRQRRTLWVDSRVYEDIDTPKLTRESKVKEASLVSFDEGAFNYSNKGFRPDTEYTHMEVKADVRIEDLDPDDVTSKPDEKEAPKAIEVEVTYAEIDEEKKTKKPIDESLIASADLDATYAKVNLAKKWSMRRSQELNPVPPGPNRPPSDYVLAKGEQNRQKPPEPARPLSEAISILDDSFPLLNSVESKRPASAAFVYENFGCDVSDEKQDKNLAVVYEDTVFEDAERKKDSIIYEDAGYEDLEDVKAKVASILEGKKN